MKLYIPSWYRADYTTKIETAPQIVHDKIFANHVLSNNVTDQQYWDRGVTHLSKDAFVSGTYPASRKCYLYKPDIFPNGVLTTQQIQAAAQNIAGDANSPKTNRFSIITDQFREGDSDNPGQPSSTDLPFYQHLSTLYGAAAENNNIYGSYDSYVANFNPDFFFILNIGYDPTHPRFTNALGSEAGARMKGRNIGDWSTPQSTDSFYTSGLSDYSNSLSMMLYSIDGVPEDWLYYGIFEIQRKYAAKINAKTLAYTSPWNQSVTTGVDTYGANPGWVHPRTGGYWRAPTWHIMSAYQNITFGFLGCLLAEGVYLWEGLPILSNSINDDRYDPYLPPPTWVSQGGNAPTLGDYGGGNAPYYPKYPASTVDEVQIGVSWYSQVKDIVNASTGIAYAAYTTNGNQVSIKSGDPRLFRRGFRNYGQDSILSLAKNRKGVALACEGLGRTVIFYTNPYLSPHLTENIVVTFNGKTYQLGELSGAWPHVFILGDPITLTQTPTATIATRTPTASVLTGNVCKRGPTLSSITNQKTTGLTFLFDGQDVFSIRYRVKSGDNIIVTDTVSPQFASVDVVFPTEIASGAYVFEIEGNSCTSLVSSLPFTILPPTTSTSTPTQPPPVGPLANRKTVWNFEGLSGAENEGSYNLAKGKIDVISYNDFYWFTVERSSGVFNYDEIDWLLSKMKNDGFKLILWFKPVHISPTTTKTIEVHNKNGDGTYSLVQDNPNSYKWLQPEHWDRDRTGRIVNQSYNLGIKTSFNYLNPVIRARYFEFVAKTVDYIYKHPLFNDVIEGMGMMDGDYNETSFTLQNDIEGTDFRGDAGYSDSEMYEYALWLERRYVTLANLNAKWGTNYTGTFTSAISRTTIPLPSIYEGNKIIAYNDNKATRDLLRFRLKKHRDFYIEFCNVVKNPSLKINTTTNNTQIQTFAYITENFHPAQGITYGVFALKYMYEMFDNLFSSVTSGSGSTNTASYLGDITLRAMLLLGTFGRKGFGQETDADIVESNISLSKLAERTFRFGYKYVIVALQRTLNYWTRTVQSSNGVNRVYSDDILYTKQTFCNNQLPSFPTITNNITYTDFEASKYSFDPGGEQRYNEPNLPGKKTEWKNLTNIDNNNEGNMSTPTLLTCASTFVDSIDDVNIITRIDTTRSSVVPGILYLTNFVTWNLTGVKDRLLNLKNIGYDTVLISFTPFRVWSNPPSNPNDFNENNLIFDRSNLDQIISYACDTLNLKVYTRLHADIKDFTIVNYGNTTNNDYLIWRQYCLLNGAGEAIALSPASIDSPPMKLFRKFINWFQVTYNSYYQSGKFVSPSHGLEHNQEAQWDYDAENISFPDWATYQTRTQQLNTYGESMRAAFGPWDFLKWDAGSYGDPLARGKRNTMGYSLFTQNYQILKANHGSDWGMDVYAFLDTLAYTWATDRPNRFFSTEYFRSQNLFNPSQMADAITQSINFGALSVIVIYDSSLANFVDFYTQLKNELVTRNRFNSPRQIPVTQGELNYTVQYAFENGVFDGGVGGTIFNQWKAARNANGGIPPKIRLNY